MAAEEIFPSVYALPLGYVNAFLLAEEDGLTLVDSGLRGNLKAIQRAIRGIGRKPEDIRHILITHHHADHVGGLATLKANSGATVYAHPLDAPVVSGESKRPGVNPGSMLGKVAGPLVTRLSANNPPPATVDREVNEGDELPIGGGIQVIHTPGHTIGSVAYLAPMHGGVLFAGDAAAHMFGRLGKPMLMFTEDMEQAKDSIRRLAGMEFDTACFGHGTVVKGQAVLVFRRYVEKMAR